MELEEILAARRLRQRRFPFPHIVGHDLLRPSVYREVEEAFREELRVGLPSEPERGDDCQARPDRFARSVPGYGAFIKAIAPDIEGPLSLFVSRPWHDMIAGLTGVDPTLDVNGALHHHPIGSPSGWIHNDLNPGWFVDRPRPDGVNISDPSACNYQDGTTPDGARPRETVRAAVALFFLANEPWAPGDGGETGLFAASRAPLSCPAAAAPPVNNTLVSFALTPFTYHAFLSNRRSPRNSVVVWLHVPKERIIARHGAESIERWPVQ